VKIKKELDGECLNCGATLQVDDHFCPRCGQKVDRNDLRLRAVFSEFIENYLSLDSRLGKTLIPFFFKPGYLSEQFINGVRRNYANPFRLYIFTSIFFFFCFNSYLKNTESDNDSIIEIENEKLRDFDDLSTTDRLILNKSLKPEIIETLNNSDNQTFADAITSQRTLEQQRIINLLGDSSLAALALNTDSILNENELGVSWNSDAEGLNIDFNFDELAPYRFDKNYTDDMLYDSLVQSRKVEPMEELLTRRAIKLYRADPDSLSRHILGNLSLAMFVLIPLYAFFVRLLYWRRNKYYVAHLIHTIYLQSFAFFIFGGLLLCATFVDFSDDTLFLLFRILAFVFLIYFIASFRRIYKQAWIKLLFKSILLIGIYQFLAAIVFLGEIVISALMF